MSAPRFLHSAQVMRVIAIFAVIVIHTAPYYYWTEKGNLEISLYYFLNGTARFAIPYFFIISGYFFIGSVKRRGVGPALSGFLSRIMLLYVVWGAVFAFLPRVKDLKKFGYWDAVWRKSIGAFQEAPLDFIFSSPGTHLWFLAALALSAALAAAFIAHKRLGGLLVFTGLLYAVGLLGGLYRDSPIGLSLFMDAKLGPFGGPFIFALGVWCGQRGLGAGKGRYDIPLIIIGWATHHHWLGYDFDRDAIHAPALRYAASGLLSRVDRHRFGSAAVRRPSAGVGGDDPPGRLGRFHLGCLCPSHRDLADTSAPRDQPAMAALGVCGALRDLWRNALTLHAACARKVFAPIGSLGRPPVQT